MPGLQKAAVRYDHYRMSRQPTTEHTQSQILHVYTALHQLRTDWGGSIILSLGLNQQGCALSIASTIAGAVSLTIDNDPAHLREATRSGAVDFTVNSLDEALRAMKNEVRKHTPLAVALSADPIHALDEILERGLAPQLIASFLPLSPRISQAAATLHTLGAALIDFTEATELPPGFRSSQALLAPLLEEQRWTLQTFTLDTLAALRAFDARALALLASAEPTHPNTLRRRWLHIAPRILPRQRALHRTLWLTESEVAVLNQPEA